MGSEISTFFNDKKKKNIFFAKEPVKDITIKPAKTELVRKISNALQKLYCSTHFPTQDEMDTILETIINDSENYGRFAVCAILPEAVGKAFDLKKKSEKQEETEKYLMSTFTEKYQKHGLKIMELRKLYCPDTVTESNDIPCSSKEIMKQELI